MTFEQVKFGDFVNISTRKTSLSNVDRDNYISTENMLPDCGGVLRASSIPSGNSSLNGYEVNDTLFSNIRTYFRKVWLANKSGAASPDVLVLSTNDPYRLDPHYLYYVVANPEFIEYTDRTSKGAKMPRGDKDAIKRFEFPLPSVAYQKTVAEILKSLDDRILLLYETNSTLEAIAQSIFRSWFIDFDPVRAKSEGLKLSAVSEDISSLFANTFNETVLGEVPSDWTVLSFRETIDIIGGGTPKTSISEYWDGAIPWFSVVDAPHQSNVFVIDTEKHISETGLAKSSTRLLPVGTTIISARGTVGKLALTGVPMAMNQSCYGLRGKAEDQYFTYYSTLRLVENLKQRAHGSVFDTITQDTFSGVLIAYPSKSLINAFEDMVSPLMLSIKQNLLQANSLKNIRDTLLPRLISGQLSVNEAERESITV